MTDWDGVEYRKVNTLQQWLADRALSGLDLEGVVSLLDIGCGDGRITAEIAARIPEATVVGLDPSPHMISIAPAGGSLSFELGDVCSMTFSQRFDAVVSFNALHWVLDQRRALERIAAALHPTGWALLVFVCRGERPSLEDIAMRVAAAPRWVPYFTGFEAPFVHPDVMEWSELAASCGLTVTDCEARDVDWDFGSREEFMRWCAVGFGAWTDRLPEGAAAEFVADVTEAYEKVSGAAGMFRFMQLHTELKGGVQRSLEPRSLANGH